ncbi:MAG: dihydrofolate reductase [Clostridia bacterium]|nr:dihydrofolate reductase [Clostridia bacterium]
MELIVAVDKGYGIGKNNSLLCRISEDMKRFREVTLNRTVLMGYKTLMSLPGSKPLKDRDNVVLTSRSIKVEGARVVHSVNEALMVCDPENTVVIGGESVYRQFLPFCEKAHVTFIDERFDADAFFPALDENWKLEKESETKEHEGHFYTFREYVNEDLFGIYKNAANALYPECDPGRLRTASYNTLHLLDDNSVSFRYHPFRRLKMIAGLVSSLSPDSVGLQEVTIDAREELLRLLPDYAFVECGRPGRSVRYKNYTPIFYKKSALRLAGVDYFSFAESGMYSVSAARFESENGKLIHLNTHLSVFTDEERVSQAKRIAEKLKELKKKYPDAAFVLTGDFNSASTDRVSDPIKAAGLLPANDPGRDTWHTPGVYGRPLGFALDHAFTDCRDTVCFVADDPFSALASDHSPVVCDIRVGN